MQSSVKYHNQIFKSMEEIARKNNETLCNTFSVSSDSRWQQRL